VIRFALPAWGILGGWLFLVGESSLGADEAPPKLGYPIAVAVAPDGSTLILDDQLRAIVKRDAEGKLSIVARAGSKDRTPLRNMRALAIEPDGRILAGDSATRDVYRIEPGQPPKPLAGGALEIPTGLAVDKDGSLLVCDLRLGSLMRIPKDGGTPAEIARVPAPRGLTLAPDGDIVVLCSGPDQVLRVNAKGEIRPLVKGKPFKFPLAIAPGPGGETAFVVSDGYSATVWAVNEAGETRPLAKGDPLKRPEGLVREPSGSWLVADAGAVQIFRIAADGKLEPVLKVP
jgi:sugar lactone lactonase YvrE